MTHWRINTHVPKKMLKLLSRESLGEDICNIVIGRTIHELEHRVDDELPYKMVLYLDVLRPTMEHWILHNCDATMVVTHHHHVVLMLVQILKLRYNQNILVWCMIKIPLTFKRTIFMGQAEATVAPEQLWPRWVLPTGAANFNTNNPGCWCIWLPEQPDSVVCQHTDVGYPALSRSVPDGRVEHDFPYHRSYG